MKTNLHHLTLLALAAALPEMDGIFKRKEGQSTTIQHFLSGKGFLFCFVFFLIDQFLQTAPHGDSLPGSNTHLVLRQNETELLQDTDGMS